MINISLTNTSVNKKLSEKAKKRYAHLSYGEACQLAKDITRKQRYQKQFRYEAKRALDKKKDKFGKFISSNHKNIRGDLLNPDETNVLQYINLASSVASKWVEELYQVVEFIKSLMHIETFNKEFAECKSSEAKIQKVMKNIDNNKKKHRTRIVLMVLSYYLKYINIVYDGEKYELVIDTPTKETIIANIFQRMIDAVNSHKLPLSNKCGFEKWVDINLRDTRDALSLKFISIIRTCGAFDEIIEKVQQLSVNFSTIVHKTCTTMLIDCSSWYFTFVLTSVPSVSTLFILNINNNYYLFLAGTHKNNIFYIFLKIFHQP